MSVLNTLSSLSSAVNIGNSALSLVGMGAALVKEKKAGIDGFLFDIAMTDNITHTAQITDHYAEDNSYIQDHVAIAPMTITLVGKVGELVYTRASGITFLKAMADRLTPLGVLTPSQSLQAQKAISAFETAKSAYKSLEKNYRTLSDLISGKETLNRQQEAYAKLEGFFLGRSLLSVETPWKTYQNMVIESLAADQDESSNMETTFTVTFKQMRFVEIKTAQAKMVGRAKQQISQPANRGTQRGKTITPAVKQSTYSKLFDSLF